MIRGIDHITLVVGDLGRSVKFYTETLGFARTGQAYLEGEWVDRLIGIHSVKAEVVYLVPPNGKPRIELLSFKSPLGKIVSDNSLPNTIGLRHLAMEVEDIDRMYNRLKAAGAEMLSVPVSVPSDVESGKGTGKKLFYFLDPDGILLELAEYDG
jgi:catechol 2,3-dioxygenase-like lactoylglutathione lyase family enzyme